MRSAREEAYRRNIQSGKSNGRTRGRRCTMSSDTLGKLDAWETSIDEQVGSKMDRKICHDESTTVHGKTWQTPERGRPPAELTKNRHG